jgi:hypothetical protein
VEREASPKPLLDKLGVKMGMKVAVVGVQDGGFVQELATRTGLEPLGRRARGCHLVFYGADTRAALQRLPSLEPMIRRDGAIWVVFPKGRTDIREVEVIGTGVAGGLVDIKVARFSDTHTALKFVIPVSKR